MWLMFGLGFVVGILVMWLWAILAIAGQTARWEEMREGGGVRAGLGGVGDTPTPPPRF